MIINTTNIKSMLGITTSTYDTRISLAIPQLLEKICNHCRSDFIQRNYTGYVYDNCPMSITTTTITLTTDLSISVGDFIRLYDTKYNDGMYQVKTYTGGVITIETAKTMKAETVSSGIIALIEFPTEFLDLISEHISKGVVNSGNISKEKINDVEVNYFKPYSSCTFISNNISELNNYRYLYKQKYKEVFGGD